MRQLRGLLILLLAPFVASCYATQHVPLRGEGSLAHATGVRMRSGEQIQFAVTGATITNDTLRAVGKHTSIAIPTDSIAEISVRKFSGRNTAGLLVGVGAVAFLVLVLLSYQGFSSIN